MSKNLGFIKTFKAVYKMKDSKNILERQLANEVINLFRKLT